MKRSKLKRKARNPKNACWAWFSKYWHLKHKGKRCVQCGSRDITPGHIIPKSRGLIYYFMESDIAPQCGGHNLRHNYDPTDYNNWFISKFGLKKWQRIADINKRYQGLRTPYIDFEGRIERYKKWIKDHTS